MANGRQARAEIARTGSTVSRMGRAASRAGRVLGAAFAVGALARAAVAVGKVGATYVSSLNKIQALTGSTDAQMGRLASRLESQSSAFAKFGQTTGDAAAGMVELTKSGLSAQKALGAIRGTMVLAKAGELEVADASTLVANTLNTFGLKAKAASKIANGLANAANISSADVSDLAESFKYAAPLAAKAGVSLDQTNAILAELSNSGIKASQAGTTLRGILLGLQAPSTAGGMWLDELGVKVYGAGGKMRDLGNIIEDMRVGLGKLSEEDQNFALKSIFGRNSITGASVLIKGGVKSLDQYTAGVRRAGAATKLAESASKGLAGTLSQVKAMGISSAQSLYRQYSPAIDKVLRKVIAFATEHKKVLIPALVGAAAAATAVAVAIGAIALVTSPVALAVVAVAGLGAAIAVAYQRSERFRALVAATGDVIQTKVVPAVRSLATTVQTQVIPAVVSFANCVSGTVVPAVVRTAQEIGTRLRPIATQLAETFRNDIRPTLAQVVAKFQEWQPGLKRAAEAAGRVYAKMLILEAAIAGKVIPAVTRLAGLMVRIQIPTLLKVASAGVKYAQVMLAIDRAIIRAAQAVGRFAAAVQARMNQAVQVIAGIPGRIKAAVGDLSNILYAAGRSVIGGLISGIVDKAQELWSALGSITSQIPLHKGPPAKDKKLLRPTGRLIMSGLIKGIEDGGQGVATVLGRITNLIDKKLDGKKLAGRRKALLHSLKDERAALVANGKAQDRASRALDKAIDKYRALRQAANQFAASIKGGFRAYGSIVGLGTTGGGSAVTLPALLSQLTARASIAQQFASVIAGLRDKLNKTSLKQLLDQASSGDLEGALATAQAIASGGATAIQQINQLTSQIAQAGADLAEKMRQKFYGHGLRVAQGVIDGLKRQEKQLDRVADRLARQFVRQVGQGLHMTVAAHSGSASGSSGTGAAARNAYVASRVASRVASTDGAMTVNITVQAAPGADGVKVGRDIAKSLDTYFKAGGRAKVKWAAA